MIKNCKNISWGVLYLQRIPIATTNSWGRHSFLHGKKELFAKKVFDFEFLENHSQAHVPLTTRLESSMFPASNNGREGTRLCGIGMFLSSSSSSSSLSAPLRGRGLWGVAAKQRHDAIKFHLCMTCPNEAKKATAELCYLENVFAEVQSIIVGWIWMQSFNVTPIHLTQKSLFPYYSVRLQANEWSVQYYGSLKNVWY